MKDWETFVRDDRVCGVDVKFTNVKVVATSVKDNVAEVVLQVTGEYSGGGRGASYVNTCPCGEMELVSGKSSTVERSFVYKKRDTGWNLLDPAYRVKRIENSNEAFIAAVASGNLAEVDRLIAAGASVNARLSEESFSVTALMAASEKGYVQVVQALLDKGVDVNAKRTDGKTALTLASAKGHHSEIEQVLSRVGARRSQ
jgi:hypothetical protein